MSTHSHAPDSRPSYLGSLALTGAYCAVGLLFRSPVLQPFADALVFPPLGLALAGLLTFGLRLWPGVVAGALLEPWLAGVSLAASLGPALGTVLAAVGAAHVLQRAGFQGALGRVRDVLLLVSVAGAGGALVQVAVATAVGLLTGASSWGDLASFGPSSFRANALGLVLVAPPLVTWAADPGLAWLRSRRGEALAYLGGLLGVTYFATGEVLIQLRSGFPTRYLVFPFLFWGALRLGPFAVATANVIVVFISASGSWLALGILPGEPVADRLLLLWAYSLFGSVTGLVLAANTKERETAKRQAEVIAQGNAALTRSLDQGDVLGTLLTSLGRLVPYDTASVLLREGGVLVRCAGRGDRPGEADAPGLFPTDGPFWDRLQQGSLSIADLGLSPDVPLAWGGPDVRCGLAVPLRAGGEWIGLYTLGKTQPGFFTAEHLRLAESLAAQGAVAIANARLYEQSRRDQEALRASEARFATAFLASPVAMSISDMAEGRFVEVNEAFIRLTGHERDEAKGRSGRDLDLWVEPGQRESLFEQVRRSARVSGFECRLRTKSGSERIGLMFAETVDFGAEPHLLTAVLDVTETRRLEVQMRQAQKTEAIGRLAGGVAHDFNNMMMAIGARCELLARDLSVGHAILPAIEEIQAITHSAASLSRQLLTFSRKQAQKPQPLRLDRLCEQSLRMLRRLIGSNIEIRFLPGPDTGNVRADPPSLEQVVMNLCVNARDAMPKGGVLTIDTAAVTLEVPLPLGDDELPPGRYARLRVSDTGVGIDASIQGQIFDPFFTTKEEGKGTGLGLSVAYGVVRQSGGAILVDSVPGRGSIFTVYLPTTDEALEDDPRSTAPPAARGSETILLVEDHDALRVVIAQYLEGAGYVVLAAPDGQAALDLVRDGRHRVDLLVTDVIMPGLTGRQLAEELTGLRPGLRVIFLSGHSRDVISPDGTLPTSSLYLEKPYPLPELVRQVRSLLDAP